VQGYCLIEYSTLADAQAAIKGSSGTELLEQVINVDYAFVRPPPTGKGRARDGDRRGGGRARERSRSPAKEDDDFKE
jgi:RNA-binding protein 8A